MPAGRPTKFKPEFVKAAAGLCRLGATEIEVADALGVNKVTLWRWQAAHKALRTAMKLGRKASDERVERSLYTSATGYEHDEIDIRVIDGKIVKTKVRKFYPPVPTSMIFWLKNRQSLAWKDKMDHTLSSPNGGPVEYTEVRRTIVDPVKDKP